MQARIDESTRGTIRYTTSGEWFVLEDNGEQPTDHSYFRVACQTPSSLSKKETMEKTGTQ